MKTKYLIAIDDFCVNHNVDISFISSLEQIGLINITTIENSGFIPADQLLELEKYVHFYYELDINLEGIETITYLLEKITNLQQEKGMLTNRLRLYESE
ncbi:MAG: chaperone modulator CbpM [Paludibacter sp.]|nr:chaperone modulator CbpM [Paludibacter sp.]